MWVFVCLCVFTPPHLPTKKNSSKRLHKKNWMIIFFIFFYFLCFLPTRWFSEVGNGDFSTDYDNDDDNNKDNCNEDKHKDKHEDRHKEDK